jgi:hypothetical protein
VYRVLSKKEIPGKRYHPEPNLIFALRREDQEESKDPQRWQCNG